MTQTQASSLAPCRMATGHEVASSSGEGRREWGALTGCILQLLAAHLPSLTAAGEAEHAAAVLQGCLPLLSTPDSAARRCSAMSHHVQSAPGLCTALTAGTCVTFYQYHCCPSCAAPDTQYPWGGSFTRLLLCVNVSNGIALLFELHRIVARCHHNSCGRIAGDKYD